MTVYFVPTETLQGLFEGSRMKVTSLSCKCQKLSNVLHGRHGAPWELGVLAGRGCRPTSECEMTISLTFVNYRAW